MSQSTVSRHHADWLSLVEVSGPFVSLPVLLRAFPQGLDARDPAQAKALREAFDDWQDNPTAPGKQRAWVMHVCTALLAYPLHQISEGQTLPVGLEARMPEMGETLRPDFALVGPAGTESAGQAQLLIVGYPAEQALDKPVIGKHWKATPATRMMELLHGSGVPLGLVTNGEQWMLVYAPRGEVTGYASWYASLWLDEPITLRAFHSLLGVHRFFGVAAAGTLPALLKESASNQQEVTDQLGYQVREAVEVLVQSFDALDKESSRTLLRGISATAQYEAALTVMMRLVFLFSAEERGLLHLGKPLYDNNYAVSTLQEQLQEVADQHGEEVLERRSDAWARLLASFRAVHGGIRHQDLLMQAYGGSLFDPDRYAFLEGRTASTNWRNAVAKPLAVNNRVVLHLLNSLQRLRIKAGAGGIAETRRVSFRALGVEQIGHVYEGLLDHTAVRASEVVLGIKGTGSKEPEIPLSQLESLLAEGRDKLIDFIKEETGRSISAIKRALDEGGLLDEHRLRVACDHNDNLLARLRPFAGLIRGDSFDQPLVVLAGSVFVTEASTRRSTGAHYTPPTLTEPIVQHTLEPLVYIGPAEGMERDKWILKSPKDILALRVCDMAMGSGAFLVQACRYLAERLTEAWENEEGRHPGEVLITPDGEFSQGTPSERLIPGDVNERIAIARRVVADRCLYGVDINPMAVEMARLSLWLITVDAHRPFTFLDHALKCGDSLLGVTSLEQVENFSMRQGGGKQHVFSTINLWRHIDEAKKKRELLEAMPSDTPEQILLKAALYAEAQQAVTKLSSAADILVAVELQRLKGDAYESERETSADQMMVCWAKGLPHLQQFARTRLDGRNCFHWVLEFPEIVGRGGFDAFIGNPPFLFGTLAATAFGVDYMETLQTLSPPWNGKADFVIGFYKRAAALLRSGGICSFIATASIIRGESLDSGLRDLMSKGWKIYSAESPFKWPGVAKLEVVSTSLCRTWSGKFHIDGKLAPGITEILTPGDSEEAAPFDLGSYGILSGLGIKLCPNNREISPKVFDSVKKLAPELEKIFLPAIGGEQLYDLLDFSLAPRSISPEKYSVFINKGGVVPDGLPISIIDPRAYTHSAPAQSILNEARLQKLTFACGETSTVLQFSRIEVDTCIPKHKLFLFPSSDWGLFAVLQSDLHSAWAWRWGLRRKSDLVYSAKRCAATYPMPKNIHLLSEIAEEYYSLREKIMVANGQGLTKTYRDFHDPTKHCEQILELRSRHAQMNVAVAESYGWRDIELGHGFHETKQGVRYSITEEARREILNRLLLLNHERYAKQEAEATISRVTDPTKRTRKSRQSAGQMTMDL
jgi:hypothetical protein